MNLVSLDQMSVLMGLQALFKLDFHSIDVCFSANLDISSHGSFTVVN